MQVGRRGDRASSNSVSAALRKGPIGYAKSAHREKSVIREKQEEAAGEGVLRSFPSGRIVGGGGDIVRETPPFSAETSNAATTSMS